MYIYLFFILKSILKPLTLYKIIFDGRELS